MQPSTVETIQHNYITEKKDQYKRKCNGHNRHICYTHKNSNKNIL